MQKKQKKNTRCNPAAARGFKGMYDPQTNPGLKKPVEM